MATLKRTFTRPVSKLTGPRDRENGRALGAARFLGVFLMALATGIVLTHVLQMPFKAQLPGPTYVTIQNGIYQLYGPVVGAVEAGALLTAVATLFLLPRRDARFWLTLLGAICVAAMIGTWAAFIDPVNQEIATWTAREFPSDWADLRDRWAFLHTVRAILAVVGLSALIPAVLAKSDAPRSREVGS